MKEQEATQSNAAFITDIETIRQVNYRSGDFLRCFQPFGDGLQNISILCICVVEAGSINENNIAIAVRWMWNAEGLDFVSA
jgi:hypothetical protein